MQSSALWTQQDAIDWLIDTSQSTSDAQLKRKARRAVGEAYDELPLRHDWTYFTRRGKCITDASQSTGTIAYDHTGGTYEREVTLTGATWPDNARYGTIIVGNQHYLIEDRKSTTVITLRFDSNPGSDLAAGTGYEYYRALYPVPLDFRHGSQPIEFDQAGRPISFITPADWLQLLAVNDQPQNWIRAYTIRGITDDYDTVAFELTPPPSTAQEFDYVYYSEPRTLNTWGSNAQYTAGTVAVSSTTVTGTGTVWDETMAGAVIRFPFSGTTTPPSGFHGSYSNDNPAAEFRIIKTVDTTTSLTLDQAPTGTYSGVKYSIGDPLDLDYKVMLYAFLALADWRFARIMKEDQRIIDAKEVRYQRDYAKARSEDNRRPLKPVERPLPRYAELYWQP